MSEKKNGFDPQKMDEGELNRRLYEKRVKNFTLHIPDTDTETDTDVTDISKETQPQPAGVDAFSFGQEESSPKKESQAVEAISSFSDPTRPIPLESGTPTAAEKAAAKKAKEAHRQRNRLKRKKNRRFFRAIWAAMIVLVSVALGQYLVFGVNDMLASNRSAVNITVDIPKDPTAEEVASLLEEKGAIENPEFFTLYCKLTNADTYFRKGTFELDTGMDYQALVTTLQSNANRLDIVSVTFPEGLSVPEVADLLEEKGVCDADAILELCNSTTYDETYEMLGEIPENEDRVYRLEGYLFPDTYDFYVDEDPESALQKLIRNCNLKLTKNIREEAEEKGMTLDEVMTLASIVQRESANKEDMYKVSSVLQNRLNNGASMDIYTLDCDSTTYYPYRTKGDIPSNIRDTFVSAYNTYDNRGLPPGPICSPGMDAIDAVLNPAETNFYYFCHGDGGAYYAATYAEHQQNLRKAGLID